MRDKRFYETQARLPSRRSHLPAPLPAQISKPAFNIGDVLIDATPERLRQQFGRCEDAERAMLRDMRIEQNRLAAITRSDRAMRRHIIAIAKLERELEGVTIRLTDRVHEKKKPVPANRRKREDIPPTRRLPRMGIVILDRAGRRGILVQMTSVGANDTRYRPGCARLHLNYIWAENAVERLSSGGLSRCSNMGPTPELVAAAMDLKEDVARASRANANIEIRVIVRLPKDISADARFSIVHQVCEEFFGRHGLPYAAAVHPPDPHSDERNYHAHIQAGFRPMRYAGGSDWEVATELRTDLSRPIGIRLLRAVVADTMTQVSREEGRHHIYTSLSMQERGLSLKPTKKVGREQTEAYRRGEYVGVVEENIRIIADNLKRYAALRLRWFKEKLAMTPRPIEVTVPVLKSEVLEAASRPIELAGPTAKKRRALARPDIVAIPVSKSINGARRALPRPAIERQSDRIKRTPGLAEATPPRPFFDAKHSLATLDTGSSGLAETKAAVRAPARTQVPRPSTPIVPFDIELDGASRSNTGRKIAGPTLPAPPAQRPDVAGVRDAMLLIQLRQAQQKERAKLAARRKNLLDRSLFLKGDHGNPTPEYAAFLLAIREDPTILRWELDTKGRRHTPAFARGDQAFADRFALYMQHPTVRRQIGELLETVYEPGAAWPSEISNGMWRYEAGRYGARGAVAARAGWTQGDALFREMIAPSDTSPVLSQVDNIVVPDIRQVISWSDANLMRLLHPGAQEMLTIAYREQQEERVECLASVAQSVTEIERKLAPAGGGSVRAVVVPVTMPASLKAMFLRWQDEADFYLDTAQNSEAGKAAVTRKKRCDDLHLRALQAAQDCGDHPAVLLELIDRAAAAKPITKRAEHVKKDQKRSSGSAFSKTSRTRGNLRPRGRTKQ